MRIQFNDNHNKTGIEGWYEIKDNKLIVYIKPTNSWEDWISDFIAIPWYSSLACYHIHRGFKEYSRWMYEFVINKKIDPENTYIFGYSMGGGIAQILGEFNHRFNIISIDGPRTTTVLRNEKSILYYNRGSLVHAIPFWFKKIKNRVILNKKWRWFWKSHADYDIDKIIGRIL